MGKAEWGGNLVCWWLGLCFSFVCCLDKASCTRCYWWLGDARSCIQVVSFVWVLTRLQWTTQKRGHEELPLVQGQGWQPRAPGCNGTGVAERSYLTSEVSGGSREELAHARRQGWWPRGATPHPRRGSCMGPGGPRGATPRSRSGGAAVRRYSTSKVRETQDKPIWSHGLQSCLTQWN